MVRRNRHLPDWHAEDMNHKKFGGERRGFRVQGGDTKDTAANEHLYISKYPLREEESRQRWSEEERLVS